MRTYNLKRIPDGNPAIVSLSYIQAREQPDWHFPLHAHDDLLELSLAIAGEAELYCGGHRYTLRGGDLAIRNAGVPHAEVSNPDDPIEQVCISIAGLHLEGFPPDHMLPAGASPIIPAGASFDYLLQSVRCIMALCEKEDDASAQVLADVARGFLSVVIHLLPKAPPAGKLEKHHQTIQNVIAYIDENYRKKHDLESLARQFYISPFHLSRKFKQATGYTINQYIVSRRMGEAERMLIFGDADIKEIAMSCGYSNLQYFYTTFRKYTGCTPIEFRRRYLHQ